MVDQQEKLWTFDAVEAGQVGNETTVEITAENIAEYARLALNPSESYQPAATGLVSMPTMVLSYILGRDLNGCLVAATITPEIVPHA